MTYTRRRDGRIAVTIDSNVWNLLHASRIDLTTALPVSRFALFIPREVEIELAAIPDRPDKQALKAYICQQVAEAGVSVSSIMGFAHHGEGPQRRGGFGFGTFQSLDARAFYAAISDKYLVGKPTRGSQLSHNEADAALGAASLSSVVLTMDLGKSGPLTIAREHGGKILDMRKCGHVVKMLAQIVQNCHDCEMGV